MDQQISKLIELAESIGGDAWPLLVQSTYNNATVDLGITLLIASICSAGIWLCWRTNKKATDDEELRFAMVAILFMLLFGLFMTLSIGLGSSMPELVCPECETAQQVLGQIT